jgi:hypothetical protein
MLVARTGSRTASREESAHLLRPFLARPRELRAFGADRRGLFGREL